MDDKWESIGMKSKDKARDNLDQNIKVSNFYIFSIFSTTELRIYCYVI